MSEKQALINFHGDKIQTIRTEKGIYVAMKPVVENMGLDWKGQRSKLNLNKRWGVITHPFETAGGKQLVMCIPLRKLNGWLFSVNPDKVLPILKQKVIDYQEECFHVLYDYWHGKKVEQKETVKIPDFNDPVAAARAWANVKESELKAKLSLKEAEPKIVFAEHMEKTPDSISIGEFAKILCKNGYETGEKRLFQRFRELKYIFKKNGKNVPFQRVIGYDWFKFDEFTKDVTLKETGEIKKQLCQKIMITGKGQVSITKILLRELEK